MRWKKLQRRTLIKHTRSGQPGSAGFDTETWVSSDWRWKVINTYGDDDTYGLILYRQKELSKGPESLGYYAPGLAEYNCTEETLKITANWEEIEDGFDGTSFGMMNIDECTEAVEEYEKRMLNA